PISTSRTGDILGFSRCESESYCNCKGLFCAGNVEADSPEPECPEINQQIQPNPCMMKATLEPIQHMMDAIRAGY
ncbi:MAG: hypothetical protein KC496_17850, partial [Anaerolineae bacterium]|nr:hypothetical protein [Anaerolineae bacterium]